MRKTLRLVLPPILVAAAVPLAFLAGATVPAQALENGLARTPQMGWNDWNTFGCNVSDGLIRETADAMVSSGMAAAGYQYVNIDDCWSERSRDAGGNLVADRAKFPNGMKALADYLHGKGLKLGIYSSAGSTTCAGFPASAGHETQDANLWASWGIDYLKYDNCGDKGGRSTRDLYTAMRDALKATGRPILFSLCSWGQDSVWTWGAPVGNSWRTTGDIQANFGSITGILDSQVGLENYAGPGGWNDPDMLEVGNTGGALSDTEGRAHFSLWALLNAPLLAGNDLRTMSAATKETLTNTEVIAVDQNWGGKQGYRLRDDGDAEVWVKPMANGSKAVVLLNRGGGMTTISVTAAALGLGAGSSYSVRDLWAHTTASSTGTVSAAVGSHAAAMYIVSGGAPSGSSPPVSSPPASSPPPSSRPPSSPPVSSPPSSSPPPGGACTAQYRTVNSWSGGFQGEVTITAGRSAINGWTATWTLATGQTINQTWNATLTVSGATATARNMSYNAALNANASAQFGFLGTGSPTTPAVACSSP
ncbi:cellulose binding domain-containing protein [Dactylosporangium sp. NPDC049140]|uniref:cellulose binding domain-containing protein n=1 Tax=Dactylosporangium sp. NPDC049140 TaxID=3155647 RepID=UPI0033E4F5FA